MLSTKLILERLDKDRRLLERREQQSKSFLIAFMQFLQGMHDYVDVTIQDITNTARTVNHIQPPNMSIASPGGWGAVKGSDSPASYSVEGEKIGIVVGRGHAAAPTPTDYKLEDRIEHGRCGVAGVTAEFTNPSFETGDLTGWTPASSANMQAVVGSAAWTLKDGTYYCALENITDPTPIGEYAQVSQDIDLTNISHLRFQLRGEGAGAYAVTFQVLVDAQLVYCKVLASNTDYPNELADVCRYTGTHTITFKCLVTTKIEYEGTGNGAWIDNIETIQADPEIEYGGTELLSPIISDPNGEFTIRRYFTNNSGVSITVYEVGIYALLIVSYTGWPACIARDIVSPGVTVDDGQILRVTYVPQITV